MNRLLLISCRISAIIPGRGTKPIVIHRFLNILWLPSKALMLLAVGRPRALSALSLLLVGLASVGLSGCATEFTPNALDPRGPAAAEIADLWWLMFWLAMAVFVAVMILLFVAIFKSLRRQNDPKQEYPDGDDPKHFVTRPSFLLISGVLIPGIILFFLLIVSVRTGLAVIAPPPTDAMVIEVIGRMWWWEARYPEQGVVTANEIHVPVGEPIEFRLTSRDVIHSFWVPQIQGKKDMIDGKLHALPFEVSEPGVYMGICAEFCGIQHTHMLFRIIAHERADFDAWVAAQQQPAVSPVDPLLQRGQAVFFEAACHHCHMIDGIAPTLPATGVVGPDLTHFGSRLTLGAGIRDNTPEHLANWILNPHDIKPGVNMPASPMDGDDLDALVAFLMSLE
jgi:cytochrome c oxidase subunit II